MSRFTKIFVIAVSIIVIAAGLAAYSFFGPPPSGTDLSRTRATANGLYIVSIKPEKEPFDRSVLHSWIVNVTDKNGKPITGASIAVSGGMPAHGHGLPTEPQMTAELGEGKYRIDGVRFHMFGWWELSFKIKAEQGEDRIVFNLSL
jgi:hypothetical protein